MSLFNKQLCQCKKVGDRTANTEKQQCQTNGSFTREYNKCRGMEETTECLQRGKYQTKEKSNFSDYYFFLLQGTRLKYYSTVFRGKPITLCRHVSKSWELVHFSVDRAVLDVSNLVKRPSRGEFI